MTFTKKNIVYADVLADSWSTLKKNPIIFAPLAYALAASIIFVLLMAIFYRIAGASVFLSSAFSVIFFIAALFVLVHIASTQMIILSRLALHKKISCKEAMCSAKAFIPKVVVLFVLVFVALIPAAIVLTVFVLPLLLMVKAPDTTNLTIGSISLILTLLAGIFFLIMYKAWTLFIFPKLMYEKKNPAKILSESWSLLWKLDMKNVLTTFFITFGIGLGVNIVFSALEKIVKQSLANPQTIVYIVQALNVVASIIIGLWLSLFVYKVFVARYGVKR